MRGTKLDLILTSKDGLVGTGKPKGRLGCSKHETMESKTLRETRRVDRDLTVLDFSSADFGLLKDLLGRGLWD